MQENEFLKCKHGYDENDSRLDFYPKYKYNGDINKELNEFEINKYDENTNILLKLALIVFIDMYKEKEEILSSLDKVNLEFIDGNIDINKKNVMGYYDPMRLDNPFLDNDISNKKANIKIASKINNKNIPKIERYLNLIHELRHHIVSLKNNYIVEDNLFLTRIGFSEHIIKSDDLKKCYTFNVLLDEAYNEYITEILLNNVMSMKHSYIDNENIKNVLYNLRNPEETGYYKNYSYYEYLQILHPILRIEKLTNVINELTYKGYLDQLKELFNDIFKDVIDIYTFGYQFQLAYQNDENLEKVKDKIKIMERCAKDSKLI